MVGFLDDYVDNAALMIYKNKIKGFAVLKLIELTGIISIVEAMGLCVNIMSITSSSLRFYSWIRIRETFISIAYLSRTKISET